MLNNTTRRQFTLAMAGALLARGQTPDELAGLSLAEASARIRSRAVTPTQLTESCLGRIGVYNPKLNAFITVMGNHALEQARLLDAEQSAGKLRGPLHGIPIALKDNIDTAEVRTTGGSALFDDRVPDEDAEVVKRLKAAGAIVIGKANLHEFGFGGTSAHSYFGPVRNPWALDRHPGGSSGGSGAAVASRLCFGALGTDTGGSVRIPASYCGIVGLKATYGLVPIRGIIPLALSLDHCGPMTRTVEDTALMLNVLAGYDELDITSVEHPREDYLAAMKQPISRFRLGIPRAPFFDHIDDETKRVFEEALTVLSGMTRGIQDVTLPPTSDIVLPGEAYAYHGEFIERSPSLYMLPTRRMIQNGADARAADYVRGRWKLEQMRRTIDREFSDFDLVVLPTRRRLPRTVDASIERESSDEPRNPELENTRAFDVYGIPAISVPCGFSSDGLPVGLMIAGPRFSEGKVLALAQAYERATEWHKREPPLTPETPVPPLRSADDPESSN